MNNILLSICIPTYNRADKLDKNLNLLINAIGKHENIEIFISDNCSSDNTKSIVSQYLSLTNIINYHRNNENIGPDKNFLQCFKLAKGKYIWLLGDDDYVLGESLPRIIAVLSKGEYGLVHLRKFNNTTGPIIYTDSQLFLVDVDFMITFMSANIINSKYVNNVIVSDNMLSSNLLQVFFYIESALSGKQNVMFNSNVFYPQDINNSNGGYNFFKVFIVNYLTVFKYYLNKRQISNVTYKKIKRRIFKTLILNHIVKILLLNQMPNMQKDGAWGIILKNYWHEPYFYFYSPKVIYYIYKSLTDK